jgi:tetratricopeptide (TPR) repeat protein
MQSAKKNRTSAATEAADFLEQARHRISTGDFSQVISDLVNRLPAIPGDLLKAQANLLIADAFMQQKQFAPALPYMQQAETHLERCSENTPAWHSLKIDCLMIKAWAIYFNLYHPQKLDDCLNELNALLIDYGNNKQRMAFFSVVSLGMLRRYQWYNLPLEAVSHSQYSFEMARQENNLASMVSVLGELGMIHMFRNEMKLAIQSFSKAVELCGEKEIGFKTISTNYIAVCYRMLNKVAECENWTNKTLTLSRAHGVKVYEEQANSNLAWIQIKRGNLLTAEELAINSLNLLHKVQHPFLWLPIMPLLYVCLHRNDWRQAGTYAIQLYVPPRKRLPDSVEDHLLPMVQAWLAGDGETCLFELKMLVQEAEISGYL